MTDRNEGTAGGGRNALAIELLRSITTTAEQLLSLEEGDLDHDCSHGCAMDGGVRRLLIHNADHERQHGGAITNARMHRRELQESEQSRLVRDWLRDRIELAWLVMDASDDLLDAPTGEGERTVREHVEHLLYWERDSIDVAMREVAEG